MIAPVMYWKINSLMLIQRDAPSVGALQTSVTFYSVGVTLAIIYAREARSEPDETAN